MKTSGRLIDVREAMRIFSILTKCNKFAERILMCNSIQYRKFNDFENNF